MIPCFVVFATRQIECCETADEFYSTMGRLTQEMLENDLLESHELMQVSGQHGPTLAWGTLGTGEQAVPERLSWEVYLASPRS